MSEHKQKSYKPNLKYNILPVSTKEKAKVGKQDIVQIQIKHNLIDPALETRETFISKEFFHQNLRHVEYSPEVQSSFHRQEYGEHRESDGRTPSPQEEVIVRKAPTPAKLMTKKEYLSQLPEVCPRRAVSGICCPKVSQSCLESTSHTNYADSEYESTEMSSSMKQLVPLDRGDDTSMFISGLLSNTDEADETSYVRSLIPNVDDSTAHAAQDMFFKSLIINPGDMTDWERATLITKPDDAVSYDRFYLDQSSPTSEQNIPIYDGSSESLLQEQKAIETKPAEVCEQDLYCKKHLYANYPPLIQKQYFNRFPGPRNPRICTLKCSYKPCLPMRKQALQCLLRNEYCECEKGLCNMGLGFITTQP